MAHAKVFSPSGAPRWMKCFGAPALEQPYPNTSSKYADEGTAAHTLGSDCLTEKVDAAHYLGRVIRVEREDEPGVISSREFTVDEEMAMNVQVYLDYVRSYVAKGYTLLVEQKVSYRGALGGIVAATDDSDAFGTSDTILISPDGSHLVVIDLKYGQGVKVYVQDNEQLLTYGLATVETFDLLGSFDNVTLVICQPRLDHLDEWELPLARLIQHGEDMRAAGAKVLEAMALYNAAQPITQFLTPGEKQCTFCKAHANCPAAAAEVAASVFDDFQALADAQAMVLRPPPKLPDPALLGAKFSMLDQIEEWCNAVRAEAERLVFAGVEIIGPDGLAMKTVEGKKGHRAWKDPKVAEGLLVGALPPEKAYKPREVITPSVADKLLNKKKTRETWVQFMDQITQPPGKAKVVLGSHPGAPFKGETTADDFVDLSDVAE